MVCKVNLDECSFGDGLLLRDGSFAVFIDKCGVDGYKLIVCDRKGNIYLDYYHKMSVGRYFSQYEHYREREVLEKLNRIEINH